MVATRFKYRPLLFSETLERNSIGRLTLCRASCLAMGHDMETLGEWTTFPNGRRWGRAKIARVLRQMRFASGDPDREGFNQSHISAFASGAGIDDTSYEHFNVSFAEIKTALANNYAVTLSGDVHHTPAGSRLRRYVNPNVGHEMLLVGINKDRTRIAFVDPMTPHGRNPVRWEKAFHFQRFGKEFRFGNNRYVAGRFKIGSRTQRAIASRQMAKVIARKDEKVKDLRSVAAGLRSDIAEAEAQVRFQENQIADLIQEINECRSEIEDWESFDVIEVRRLLNEAIALLD